MSYEFSFWNQEMHSVNYMLILKTYLHQFKTNQFVLNLAFRAPCR